MAPELGGYNHMAGGYKHMARSIQLARFAHLSAWAAFVMGTLCAPAADAQSEPHTSGTVSEDVLTAPADAPQVPAIRDPQASGVEPREPELELEIENIVVTARKRNERVQRVPVAITALNQQNLQEIGANRIPLISPLVPNSSFTFQGATSARLTLRGLTEFDPNPTVDAAVGTYVDGVYQARVQSGQQALYDLDRIEVLRGPQGTIFGKNSLGGAINVLTSRPKFEREGEVSLKLGNYRLLETRAVGNLPVIEDKLAMRLSLATNKRDGFQRDTTGGDRDDDSLLAARFKTLYFPSESVEVLFSFDQYKERRKIAAGQCKLTDTSGLADPLSLQSTLAVFGFQDLCSSLQNSSNPRRVSLNLNGSENIRNRGTSLRVTHAIRPNLSFTSLTAYRSLDARLPGDGDGTSIDVFAEAGDSEQDQYTQEFQLEGETADGRLEYLFGLFALREKIDLVNPLGGFFVTVQGDDVVNPFPISGDPATDRQLTADLIRGAMERNQQRNTSTIYAPYAQLRYNFTPQIQFVGGVRFERDSRRIFRRGTTVSNGPCLTSNGIQVPIGTVCEFYERTERFSEFQPSAALTYRFSDNALTYVSYSKGFKSGSFNPRSLNNDLGTIVGVDGTVIPQLQERVEVDPAEQTTYEIGAKLTFLESRVQLNAAAFYSDYEAIQNLLVSSFRPGSRAPGFGNNADSAITGVELETQLLPLQNLRITANLGFLNDRYTDFDEPFIGTATKELGDGRLPFTSRYSYAVAADYLIDTDLGSLSLGTTWTGRSSLFFDPENTESIFQGKYGTLTARATLLMSDGKTEVSIVGTNLLDREYLAFGADLTNLLGNALLYRGAPRQVTVEVKRTF